MALKLVTGPISELITLAEAKSHLRVDYTDQDAEITSLITAARVYCEQFQHRAYVTQAWTLTLDCFPDGRPPSSLYALYSHPPVSFQDFMDHIKIPLAPLLTIDSIKYYLTDNTEMTMTDGTQYFKDLVSEPGRVCLPYMIPWPMTVLRPENGVIIAFTAGYGTPTAAAKTTALSVANAELVFTAQTPGAAGNNITIAYVNPGSTNTLSVSVDRTIITVTLGYATGAITSTAAQVKTAIQASADATALVSVAYKTGNDGSGIVTAMAATALTSGADIACPFLAQLKAAMLLLIGHLYEHREDVTSGVALQQVPRGVDDLLWPNRVW